MKVEDITPVPTDKNLKITLTAYELRLIQHKWQIAERDINRRTQRGHIHDRATLVLHDLLGRILGMESES